MPIVAIYEYCNPIFVIKYGLYIRMQNSEKNKKFHVSFLLYIKLDIIVIIPIIIALASDGVKPVSTVYNISTIIVTILPYLFPKILFNKTETPIII